MVKKLGKITKVINFIYIKKIKKKRWVLYKKQTDPTNLEVEWQIWLTETNKDKEIIINKPSFNWQKNKKANLTGTVNSYHPAKNSDRKKVYVDKTNKNSVWEPDL